MTKISIVMPVYNNEKYLETCLDSIVNQTFKDFELICVNDGSKDGSLEILNRYSEKYNFIKVITQENQGAGAARNNGFELVQSETTLFLDSDDEFYPEFLEKMYDKYYETNADIVICRYNATLPDGSYFAKEVGFIDNMLPKNNIFNKYDIPDKILNFTTPAIWNKLLKTDLIRKYNLKFDNTSNSNDITFTFSALFFAEKITTINDILINYKYFSANSITLTRQLYPNIELFDIFKNLYKIICEKDNTFQMSLYNAELSCSFYHLSLMKSLLRKDFIKLIKNNIPLKSKKYIHKPYMYYRLLLIKKLPIPLFAFIFELKLSLKKFFNIK